MTEFIDLVVAAQTGDHDAFEAIVARFQNMAYAGAYAMTGDSCLAQDVAQEAFIDAYLSLGKLQEPAAFPGWFRRILIKHSDRQTRGKRLTIVPLDEVMILPAQIPDPALLVEQLQVKQTVHEAIASLPQEQRLVTSLFYVQGYSQKEIAQFLELPVTTIKKRLYTARQKLKERMITMLKEHLQENKPSRSDEFTKKIQFFIALRANDLDKIKQWVDQEPGLVHIKTTWDASVQGYYWPLGVTPLFWAATTGNVELATFLLARGADVNAADHVGATPLHHAIRMGQPEITRLLLEHGANVNARSNIGQTPLHLAVLRDNQEVAGLLLTNGAEVMALDHHNYTPMHWAMMKGYVAMANLLGSHGAEKPTGVAAHASTSISKAKKRRVPVGQEIWGRVIDGSGQPIDDGPPLTGLATQPIYGSITEPLNPILETGLKIIDLLAPIKRGGHVGLFTPLSGVGYTLVLCDLMYRMVTLHDGYIVYLGLEDGSWTARSLVLAWRGEFGLPDSMVENRMVHLFGQASDSPEKRDQVVETGLTLAEDIRRQGHDVLLVVDERLAYVEEVVSYLKANAASTSGAAITTLYRGDYTVGTEPAFFSDLDAVITFNIERALQKLSPAVDPLRSYSKLLQTELIDKQHIQIAAQTRKLLQRYYDLHFQVERYGLDSLWYLSDPKEDETIAIRTRRLHRFLTQPLVSAEIWANIPMLEGLIGIPSQHVKVTETLAGCQAILEGRYDSLPEEAFYFVGAIEQVVEKAKRL